MKILDKLSPYMLYIKIGLVFLVASLIYGAHLYDKAVAVAEQKGKSAAACAAAVADANTKAKEAQDALQKQLDAATLVRNDQISAQLDKILVTTTEIRTGVRRYAMQKPLPVGCHADDERVRAANAAGAGKTRPR